MGERIRSNLFGLAGVVLTAAWLFGAPAFAQQEAAADAEAEEMYAGMEKITIIARKRKESLQDVPIAVTALSGQSLSAQKIDDTLDIQFKVPNLSFGKTNFTGSNLRIRGIGTDIIGASGEPGVGVHVNTVPLTSSRIFEQEFYDVDSVEVLRGPQGTLFGRNSTGGSLNLSTRKPTDEYESSLEMAVGRHSSVNLNGSVNMPVHDRFRMRFAGMFHDRDGYLKNHHTDNLIDDRQLWSLRGSFQADVTENTTADLMVSYFREDDARSRIGKQLCKKDTSAAPFSLGCTNGTPGFESTNYHGTLPGILESTVLFGLGVAGLPVSPAAPAPLYPVASGLASVDANANSTNPPNLRAHDARIDPSYKADELLLTLDLRHELENLSLNWVSGYQNTTVDSRQDYTMARPSLAWTPTSVQALADTFGIPAIGNDGSGNATHLCLGEFGCNDRGFSQDRSKLDHTLISTELRVVSDYDGPLNFTGGAVYSYNSSATDYIVFFSGAEVVARVYAANDAAALSSTYDLDLRFFNNETKPAITNSFGLFGEGYYDLTDDTKLTLGVRYTYDRKSARARQNMLNSPRVLGGTGQKDPYIKFNKDWHAGTGRISVDHSFDFDFMDQSLVYGSISRGYKPGGFNPPAAAASSSAVNETFDQETIWAYEVGTKNRYCENRLQTNVSAFFYDYRDYQISKIVARTSVNENIDAYLWGLEAEFVAMPVDDVQLDLSIAYLGSRIRNSTSIDPVDPTAGDPSWTAVKNVTDSTSVIGSNQITSNAAAPTNTTLWHPAGGIAKNLDGREMPNTPDIQINIGGQYTWDTPWHAPLTGRINYYWQSEMFGRMFNEARDRIDTWSQADAILHYEDENESFYVDVWVKNFTDNDDITTHYLTDASSGNFTNVFILEPRTFGITVGTSF